MAQEETTKRVREYIERANSDLYVFSGEIRRTSASDLLQTILRKSPRRPKATLFLTTYGGDPHAAYRIARTLRRLYSCVRLLIVGPCKSAGTLMALGADELAFGAEG